MFNHLTLSVFKTIFSRRDTKIFLSFSLLPILVPFLVGNMEAIDADYTRSFLSFLDTTLLTQYSLTLPILIFSILISSVFRDEIDSGTMFLYKDIKRSKIFHSKMVSLILVYGLYLLGTSLATLMTYYGVMLPKYGVGINFLPLERLALEASVLNIIATVLLNLIAMVIVSMVSVKSKTLPAVLSGVFVPLFAVTGKLLVGIKYVIPLTYTSEQFGVGILVILALSIIYFLFPYFTAKKRFEKVEF